MSVAFGIQHDLDIECLVHFTTRDRNLMALESELLGAHALGVRNILALTGDPPRIGDYPTGTGVWDVDSIGLAEILARLNRGEDGAGSPIGQRAGFTIACALDPTAADRADRVGSPRAQAGRRRPSRHDPAALLDRPGRGDGRRGPPPVRAGRLPGPRPARARCRSRAHGTPSSCTMRCRGSRSPTRPGRRWPRPAIAVRRSDSNCRWRSWTRPATLVAGTYLMPSFGRYEQAAELVRRIKASEPVRLDADRGRSDRDRPEPAFSLAGRALLLVGLAAPSPPPPGRRIPAPVEGQRVYDTAGVLSAETIADAEQISREIEARTGAQVVVYTQVKPDSDTPELAERDAVALIDQWGIGRKGFDDGMVILFDLDESLRHGQVQLYAGPGFRVSYLSNEDRQAIFENDMLPLPARRRPRPGRPGRDGPGGRERDAARTPTNSARGRLINAVIGVIARAGAVPPARRMGRLPLDAIGSRPGLHGRSLRPHAGAAGRPDRGGRGPRLRRQVLASRAHDGPARPGQPGRAGLRAARGACSRRRSRSGPTAASLSTIGTPPIVGSMRADPLGDAESYALESSGCSTPSGDLLEDDDLLKFGSEGGQVRREARALCRSTGTGSTQAPSKVVGRWAGARVVELVGGVVALFAGLQIPFAGPGRARRRAPRRWRRDGPRRPRHAGPDLPTVR